LVPRRASVHYGIINLGTREESEKYTFGHLLIYRQETLSYADKGKKKHKRKGKSVLWIYYEAGKCARIWTRQCNLRSL